VIVDPSIRPLLGRVERLLIGYGVVSFLLAALAVVALVVALARVNGLADRLGGDASAISSTIERTATVLDTAAASARGFETTVGSSTNALNQAAADLREIVPRLRDIETRANEIDLLGSRPLAPIAGLFGQIAGQLGDLDGQLDEIATNLTANRTALTANATSLSDLATETRGARRAPRRRIPSGRDR
jgi:methyl-accepting chemotaxis protein